MEPTPEEQRPAKMYYTVQEAAAMLRMSENSVREGIRRGEIIGRKVGRSYRVSWRAFAEDMPSPEPKHPPDATWS